MSFQPVWPIPLIHDDDTDNFDLAIVQKNNNAAYSILLMGDSVEGEEKFQ